jgi:hypothetical protein
MNTKLSKFAAKQKAMIVKALTPNTGRKCARLHDSIIAFDSNI